MSATSGAASQNASPPSPAPASPSTTAASKPVGAERPPFDLNMQTVGYATAGFLARMTGAVLTSPLDTLKTRLQFEQRAKGVRQALIMNTAPAPTAPEPAAPSNAHPSAASDSAKHSSSSSSSSSHSNHNHNHNHHHNHKAPHQHPTARPSTLFQAAKIIYQQEGKQPPEIRQRVSFLACVGGGACG